MILSSWVFLEDDGKEASGEAHGETADVKEVLGVDLEYHKVSAAGWDYGLGDSSSVVSTDIETYYEK